MTYDEMLSLYGTFGWFLSIKTRGALRDGLWKNYDQGFAELEKHKNFFEDYWRGKRAAKKDREDPPKSGDGFALYYNSDNPNAFKNRVVLVGKFKQVVWDPSNPPSKREHIIGMEYDAQVLWALRRKPLYKTKTNIEIFENSYIKPGVVGTFYPIAPRDWEALLREVAKRM